MFLQPTPIPPGLSFDQALQWAEAERDAAEREYLLIHGPRKRGGQPGNMNALKHGRYTRSVRAIKEHFRQQTIQSQLFGVASSFAPDPDPQAVVDAILTAHAEDGAVAEAKSSGRHTGHTNGTKERKNEALPAPRRVGAAPQLRYARLESKGTKERKNEGTNAQFVAESEHGPSHDQQFSKQRVVRLRE